MPGASEEVLIHHIKTHPCWSADDHPWFEAICPCGVTRVVVCVHCEEPVIVASESDPPCVHGQELIDWR